MMLGSAEIKLISRENFPRITTYMTMIPHQRYRQTVEQMDGQLAMAITRSA